MTSIYNISIRQLDGTPLNWDAFKQKKILIVNVASECGLTPQYEALQELQDRFKERLIVLGCPCNDFGAQEPGTAATIKGFCEKNYGVTFPLTEKIGITTNTHPLYEWLTSKVLNGVDDFEVEWNFHKFLINKEGTLFASKPSVMPPNDQQILAWIRK